MKEESDDEERDMSAEIGELASALATAQSEFETIRATRTGQTGHRQYRYADLSDYLETALKVLPKHGLAIIQRPQPTDGKRVHLQTILVHKSGQFMSGELVMICDNATPQGIGSTITYARRYSVAAMLGLAVDEDDDGRVGSLPARPATATHATPPKINIATRNRIIRSCEDLGWSPQQLKDKLSGQQLSDLTQEDAESLASALEKKFLSQEAKEAF